MTAADRDRLLLKLLRAMRFQTDGHKRHELQNIGECLVSEYRDFKAVIVEANITKNETT